MFIIRNTFTAKPGMASKLAETFKESMAKAKMKVRVVTDLVGEFNTVEMEQEVPSLAEYEKIVKGYSEGTMDKEFRDRMKGYTDMYVTGRREIYKVM